MAAELTSTKLNAENHLLLDQPLLRLPHELARKNFKSVQRIVEREREYILPSLKATASISPCNGQTPDQTLAALDAMISRMQGLKRKMENLHQEERKIHDQSRKRIEHLENLHQIHSLADVKYDQWSRVRLDRLVTDYMLRSGYTESARQLAHEKDIEDLADLNVFIQCQRVAESLRRGESKDALQWCSENKAALKKSQVCVQVPLKTPSCHSAYTSSSSNSLSTTTSVCPICSTELHELARNMPYAHHTKSYVESDPIVLPNGRIYGQQRLLEMSKKVGCVEVGKVKDPTTGEVFEENELKKVYIM
ncbi:unnamed protein product [Aspergillus oryzae]|uniref:Unnamed protein product n=2 Tax=Aspergillus oryzae TaxID=5062 RepID=A0AAN4YUY3_ASPOZ|nr:unnamed protein product [Aspergillus oryzae]GMF92469.1 unnamed protein product [Aspergillus oryzae]GMG03272.1 unnamed protein product [Aspergillus oryzae]GMG37108.1 unnamed protein product [Aspergillus oryzae]GMG46190.1 unnamed protein product [Aspergillus oryzae var. brunneus]